MTSSVGVADRRRLLAAPAVLGAAGAVGVLVLRVVDLSAVPIIPPCPFLAVTGLWCPFCGGTRALEALAAGDVGVALGMNVIAVLLVPLLLLEWTRWTAGRARGRPTSLMNYSPRVLGLAAGLAVGYAVLRNLPGLEALTPLGG
jgi:hypothetical protein